MGSPVLSPEDAAEETIDSRLAPAILVLALLQGCAYQKLMRTGRKATEAQQWTEAYDAYAAAFVMRQSAGAKEGLTTVRRLGVEAELDLARKALIRDEYAVAIAHLDVVEDMDPEYADLEKRRREVKSQFVDDIQGQIDGEGPLRATYELLATFQEVYPKAEDRTKLLFAQHYKVEDAAKALVTENRFEEAVTAVKLLAEFDSEQKTRAQVLEHELAVQWADHLVERGKKAGKDKLFGLSAVLYARAYELAERPDDQAASRSGLERTLYEARIRFLLESEGDDGRHWRLQKVIRNQIENHPDVRRGGTETWTLKAKLFPWKEWCQQTSDVEMLSLDYIKGTKQVPNPEYDTIDAELQQAQTALKGAEAELKKMKPGAARADGTLVKLDKARAETAAAFEEITAKHARSKQQMAGVLDNEIELVAAVTRLEKSGTDKEVAVAKGSLKAVRKYVVQATETLAEDEAEFKRLGAELDGIDRSQAVTRANVAATQAELEAATQTVTARTEEVTAIQSRLDEHPETLTEDVPDTLEYKKTNWVTTCQGPATLYTNARWETALEHKSKIDVTKETQDSSHRGHSLAKLKADPREYPKSREELLAEVNDDTVAAVAKHVLAHIDEYYDLRLEQGKAAIPTDPDLATQTLTALYLGAGGTLDDESKAAYTKLLAETYGLKNLDLLVLTAPP